MTRSAGAAVAWAKGQHYFHTGYCQMFTRLAFAVGSGYPSATAAWRGSRHKHSVSVSNAHTIPAGVPVYWTGGSKGYGHATVSVGGGLVRSTDWPSRGRVGTARISDITRSWGLHFEGWTEDINGVRVYSGGTGAPPSGPSLDVSSVVAAARKGAAVKGGVLLKKAVVAEVGRGAMNPSTAVLGPEFKQQYELVQREFLRAIGAKPKAGDINGVPGPASLRWLGSRRGFSTKA